MSNAGLIVRRSERFEISLPARVRVGMLHIDAVKFAKGVSDPERWINVDVVDFAQGGIGFVTELFFARAMSLEIEIPNVGDPGGAPLIQCEMQVKRVQMTDRRPAYLVGCAFVGLDDEKKITVDAMIQRLMGEFGEDNPEGGEHA